MKVSDFLGAAQAQVRWVPTDGTVPQNAIIGGFEFGIRSHVCRSIVAGGFLAAGMQIIINQNFPTYFDWNCIGKQPDGQRGCFIAFNGAERFTRTFDVAVGPNYIWLDSNRNTAIPNNAVAVGFNENNQMTFVCRGNIDQHVVPGRVSFFKILPYLLD